MDEMISSEERLKKFREFLQSFEEKYSYMRLLDEAFKPRLVPVTDIKREGNFESLTFNADSEHFALAYDNISKHFAFYRFDDNGIGQAEPKLSAKDASKVYSGLMFAMVKLLSNKKIFKFKSAHPRQDKLYDILIRNKSFLEFIEKMGFENKGKDVEGYNVFAKPGMK